ncbi:MAG: hypothetical protein EOQ40_30340 [Mesorhizobium sp.]|nr:MAG: hypothetical protein EOQ40_30340 [Mesorhizobium sp.]
MRPSIPNGVFKPKASPGEVKQDATNRAAKVIIENEAAAREAKTERLPRARLAKETAEPETPPKKR